MRVAPWGTGLLLGSGPLGDGTTNGSQTPVDVVGLSAPVQQLAVASMYACALLEGGTVACWGSWEGALGLAHLTASSGLTAAPVVGLPPAKRISAYSYQTCAVLEDGTVQRWGTDFNPGISTLAPEPVPGLLSVVDLASGEFHNCVLLANSLVECWGENYFGQLGDGTVSPAGSTWAQVSETPVTVIGLP